MRVRNLNITQKIPADLRQVWDFFSTPVNLTAITPPFLDFTILSGSFRDKAYEGQIIEYTVKPIAGIPIYWMTEITHVRDLEYFVDEQRVGPYKLWHHQHHFKAIPGGVEMTDMVHYSLPMGLLGMPLLPVVKKKLDKIFAYRSFKTAQQFGDWKNPASDDTKYA
jgi:ligand-binding SRPBCC domain-containing protein